MTTRTTLTFTLCAWLALAVLTGCPQPKAEPQEPKTAKVEAKFTPENPHFPGAGTAEESPEEAGNRAWWDALEGGDGPPIAASTYTRTAMLRLPFGVDQATVEAALPAGWKQINKYEPIYDPLLLDFTSQRYTLPEMMLGVDRTTKAPAEATLGFDNGKFGDLRLLFTDLKDAGKSSAEALIAIYGSTPVDKAQEPAPDAKVHRKMITLTWRVVDEGKRSGFISYQVVYAGPTAGNADALLQPGDRFVQASFTTMTPDMMTALRAARPVGSGTTP